MFRTFISYPQRRITTNCIVAARIFVLMILILCKSLPATSEVASDNRKKKKKKKSSESHRHGLSHALKLKSEYH